MIGLWGLSQRREGTPGTGPYGEVGSHKLQSLLDSEYDHRYNRQDHILLVTLDGVISADMVDQGIFASEPPAIGVRNLLDEAAEVDRVKAVVLRINSPGGTVGMSQELHAAVTRLRETKPVVVSMGDVAASGGYYTACAADAIVANKGTLTASIGVIMTAMNLNTLLTQKLGIQPVTIKSGKFKDLLSPYRAPGAEELKLVQTLIDESYQDFLGAVLAGRERALSKYSFEGRPALQGPALAAALERIKGVADGRVVLGSQGKTAGLVDLVGDLNLAIEVANRMALDAMGSKSTTRELPVHEADEGPGFFNLLASSSSAHAPQVPLLGWLTSALGQAPAVKSRPQAVAPTDASTAILTGSLARFRAAHANQPLWLYE